MDAKKRRFNRKVDRTPLDNEGKKRIAAIKDYYRRKEEAVKYGLPLPKPPGTRSPLDASKK